mmetsp:Transcript_2255/g.4829  ORF Transcript_2255/g.4829 Transcript_2255/m.4829 type:complete len:252 (+) Transcript_2255:286-1041(+)
MEKKQVCALGSHLSGNSFAPSPTEDWSLNFWLNWDASGSLDLAHVNRKKAALSSWSNDSSTRQNLATWSPSGLTSSSYSVFKRNNLKSISGLPHTKHSSSCQQSNGSTQGGTTEANPSRMANKASSLSCSLAHALLAAHSLASARATACGGPPLACAWWSPEEEGEEEQVAPCSVLPPPPPLTRQRFVSSALSVHTGSKGGEERFNSAPPLKCVVHVNPFNAAESSSSSSSSSSPPLSLPSLSLTSLPRLS